MLEIELTLKNLKKCLCPDCPVQKDNSCIRDQTILLEETGHSTDLDGAFMLEEEKIPLLYCAKGKSICLELNFHEECQCHKCKIWKEYDLEVRGAEGYFCRHGKASECCEIENEDQDRESKLREIRRTYYTPI